MIGRYVKSLEYELTEVFDELAHFLKKSKKEIQKYSLVEMDSELDFDSDIDKELIKDKINKRNQLTKNEEKFYWTCFVDFEKEGAKIVLEKTNLKRDKVTRLIERCWHPRMVSVSRSHFEELQDLLPAPDYLEKKWSNLINPDYLIEIARKYGRQILNAEYGSISRNGTLCVYLLGIYCYHHLSQSELKEFCEVLMESDFRNTFLIVDREISMSKALLISAHLKFYRENIVRENFVDSYIDNVKMVLGDPRSVPNGWGPINEIESLGFDFWRRILNEEDIVFFFDKLNTIHSSRKQFWLKYRRTANRIFLIVDKSTKLKLEKKFSKDEKQISTIRRLLTYRSEADKDQFLIIFVFSDYVIVEGSASGFGCQIFKKEIFLQKFKKSIFENIDNNTIAEADYASFRGVYSGRLKRLPNHDANDNWIESYEKILKEEYNIKPDNEVNKLPLDDRTRMEKKGRISFVEKMKNSKSEDYGQMFVSAEFIIVDKRPNGSLWIFHDNRLYELKDELEKIGIVLVETRNGSTSTGFKHSWYLRK